MAERIWNYETGRGNCAGNLGIGHSGNFLRLSFFVLACSYLKTGADEKCICPCTDGRVIHYSPAAVLSDFQEKGRKYINRMYLHSLFHCLYLHPADREKREETLWNLACDMVAEYTVDCLGVPFLLGEPGREKRRFTVCSGMKKNPGLQQRFTECC
ncbi:MAG: DUF2201 family putative metallopeptidase [Blautia marasmi]